MNTAAVLELVTVGINLIPNLYYNKCGSTSDTPPPNPVLYLLFVVPESFPEAVYLSYFCWSFIPHFPEPHRGWSCVTDIPHCNYTFGFQILFVPVSIFKLFSKFSLCRTWKSCLSMGLPKQKIHFHHPVTDRNLILVCWALQVTLQLHKHVANMALHCKWV